MRELSQQPIATNNNNKTRIQPKTKSLFLKLSALQKQNPGFSSAKKWKEKANSPLPNSNSQAPGRKAIVTRERECLGCELYCCIRPGTTRQKVLCAVSVLLGKWEVPRRRQQHNKNSNTEHKLDAAANPPSWTMDARPGTSVLMLVLQHSAQLKVPSILFLSTSVPDTPLNHTSQTRVTEGRVEPSTQKGCICLGCLDGLCVCLCVFARDVFFLLVVFCVRQQSTQARTQRSAIELQRVVGGDSCT